MIYLILIWLSSSRTYKRQYKRQIKISTMSSVLSLPPPSRSRSPSCLMLPYGYQIDLDFIKYCENLTQPDLTDAELQRRQRRRQRQSMDVMLGIQMEMQNQMDQLSDIWERKPPEPPPRTHHHHNLESPIVPLYMKQQKRQPNMTSWDPSLNDVVDDFEKTLERSNKKRRSEDPLLLKVKIKEMPSFDTGKLNLLILNLLGILLLPTLVSWSYLLITFYDKLNKCKNTDRYQTHDVMIRHQIIEFRVSTNRNLLVF